MKKLKNLLSIISGLSLVTISSLTVVSCSPESKVTGNVKKFSEAKNPENIGDSLAYTQNFQTGFKTAADVMSQQILGTPYAKYWMPEGQKNTDIFPTTGDETIINSFYDYNPSEDKDAKYNVSNVELKERKLADGTNDFQDETGKVTHHAMGVVNKNTSGTPAQGSYNFDNYNFTNWTYVDQYTGWAGANNEGIIVLPSADIIDAAHMNGTKMLGIIYFDGYFGLTKEIIENFFNQDAKGNYLIVDKLIEVADYFGFDGWFWNNEANATETIVDETKVQGVLEQYVAKVKEKNLNQIMTMYIDHGGANVNNSKKDIALNYLTHADEYISDFGRADGQTALEFVNTNKLQEKKFNNHNMINMNSNQSSWEKGSVDWQSYVQAKVDSVGEYSSSLATFALADSYKNFSEGAEGTGVNQAINKTKLFHDNDSNIFAGTTGDPRNSTFNAKSNETAISSVINEKTTLISEEFVTNFSTGQGANYYSNGKNIGKDSIWNHRGVMDTMPTYQWVVDNSGGNVLSADFDYTKAFNKGNTIRLASDNYDTKTSTYTGGTIAANGVTEIKLLGTDIKITDQILNFNLSSEVASSDLIANEELTFKAKLEFSKSSSEIVEFTAKEFIKGSEQWWKFGADLSAYKDKTLRGISLQVIGKNANSNVIVDIGEVALIKSAHQKTSINVDFVDDLNYEYIIKDDSSANVRLYWTDISSNIDRYEIFQIQSDGTEVFLGTTRTNAYFIQNLDLTSGSTLAIKAVDGYDSTNYKMTIREVKI